MTTPKWLNRSGFTLLELMIVVAIIGVLAAVAIPAFIGYLHESKAAEAAEVLQAIREKQEAYMAEYNHYTSDIDWYPSDDGTCGECTNETKNWVFDDLSPGGEQVKWVQLGFTPGGPTYYSYSVDTGYDDTGFRLADTSYRPEIPGTTWDKTPHWFVAKACGDIDCDGEKAAFYVTSHNKNVTRVIEATDEISDSVY
jgi:prepilin-type N-terminal cleavage/methylation domain-containing protein